jgi:hypothetical protein
MKDRGWLIKALPIIAAIGFSGSLLMAFFLIGCGSSHNNEPLLVGIFFDDVVDGLEFRAGDRVGFTDGEGKFYYRETETVRFYVGGIKIGETSEAKPETTPIDLVDEDNSFVLHQTVTNICRFLQTLDEDHNPDNGIRISKETRDAIQKLSNEGLEIDFTIKTEKGFEEQDGMSDVLSAVGVAELVSEYDANRHFFKSLAKRLATPAIMINLGDTLTTGAQSGLDNAFISTQTNCYTANLSFQLIALSKDFVWQDPMLQINSDEYDIAHNFKRKYFRTIDVEAEAAVTDKYLIPYNLGVPGATTKSLINEKTSNTEFNMLDEILRPLPELMGDDPATVDVERKEISQLDAALYVANLEEHKPRLKIFTLWIGMEDTLGVVTQNWGTGLTEANINAFLGDTVAGHDLDSVLSNIDYIVDKLNKVEYSQIFIATIPHVETLGMLFGKDDIERMALFEGAEITELGANEFIGYQRFIGDFKSPDPNTSFSMALNSNNETLNDRIRQMKLDGTEDGNWLSETEKNIINTRIDTINEHIKELTGKSQEDNIFLVDVNAEIYEKLTDENGLDISTFRPNDENKIDESLAEELNIDLFLNKTMGGGFFSHDGYTPGHTGYGCIGFLFMNKIQEAGIGFDLNATFVNEFDNQTYPAYETEITDILVLDPYGFDQDADHFVGAPGTAYYDADGRVVHGYDAVHVGGWIDCNDLDAAILPFYVGGAQLGEGEKETDSPCYYAVPDYTE